MISLQIVQEPLETVQQSTGATPSPHLQWLPHSSSVSPGLRIRRISCIMLFRRSAALSACIVCPQRLLSHPCSVSRALHRLSSVAREVMCSFPVRLFCKISFEVVVLPRQLPCLPAQACLISSIKHQIPARHGYTVMQALTNFHRVLQRPLEKACADDATLAIMHVNIPHLGSIS
jgi:hypothetical protein